MSMAVSNREICLIISVIILCNLIFNLAKKLKNKALQRKCFLISIFCCMSFSLFPYLTMAPEQNIIYILSALSIFFF